MTAGMSLRRRVQATPPARSEECTPAMDDRAGIRLHHPPEEAAIPSLPHERVVLRSLKTCRVRNLADGQLLLDAEAPVRILVGANGAGKTSVLEAISMLAPGRGLRGARLPEILRHDASPRMGWTVAAACRDRFGDERRVVVRACAMRGAEAGLSDDEEEEAASLLHAGRAGGVDANMRRQVLIDGRQRGPAALAELITVTWASPAMDRLFLDGAGQRRRFFDRIVSSFYPDHLRLLGRHERAMRQRLHLLLQRGGRADSHWLAALEAQMAEAAVAIAAARLEVVERLNAHLRTHALAGFPLPQVTLAGDVEEGLAAGEAALVLEEAIRSRLAVRRDQDAREGRTGFGPHLTDFVVMGRFPGGGRARPARLASTGEQKVLLLALVVAHAELAAERRGGPVILLLDEVAAHLDEERRVRFFARLAGFPGEIWLAGTGEELFAPLEKSTDSVLLRIDEGRINH